jgi:putative transposase
MVNYRRYFVPGGTYFFTVALRDRRSNWLTKYAKQLGEAMRRVCEIHPYRTIAIVLMPDHLHTIWELPDDDFNYSLRWRCIKTAFARNVRKLGVKVEKNQFRENVIWQRRFWEHTIRNERDLNAHLDYIHYNPVKHGYVEKVSDWPYSSYHQFVKRGWLPRDWCYQNDDLNVE